MEGKQIENLARQSVLQRLIKSPTHLRDQCWGLGSRLFMTAVLLGSLSSLAKAEEAQWIWETGTKAEQPIPVGKLCFFRKTINLRQAAEVRIEIAADDDYQLFVNGRRVGSGQSSATSRRI